MNILISVDGVSNKKFEKHADLFMKKEFSYVESLQSTFPSVTFNAHATAITGNNHNIHNIFDNVVSNTINIKKIMLYGDNDELCNDQLHKQTLFYSLQKNKHSSACIHWPLTQGNSYIDYLTTEDFENNAMHDTSSVQATDNKAFKSITNIILNNICDFTAVRFIGYDSISHEYGKDSPQSDTYLSMIFAHINQIINLLEQRRDKYNLMIFSDHGQSSITQFFYPNLKLVAFGYEKFLDQDTIRFVCDGSGSCLFYSILGHEENKKILDLFSNTPEVQSIYLLHEQPFSPYSPVAIIDLKDTICAEDVLPNEKPMYRTMKSVHGFHPNAVNEMNGFLVCKGCSFPKSRIIQKESICNIAPTLANTWGIKHPCEGKVMAQLLEKGI